MSETSNAQPLAFRQHGQDIQTDVELTLRARARTWQSGSRARRLNEPSTRSRRKSLPEQPTIPFCAQMGRELGTVPSTTTDTRVNPKGRENSQCPPQDSLPAREEANPELVDILDLVG